jgi:hypothetical protein
MRMDQRRSAGGARSMCQRHTFGPASLPDGAGIPGFRASVTRRSTSRVFRSWLQHGLGVVARVAGFSVVSRKRCTRASDS